MAASARQIAADDDALSRPTPIARAAADEPAERLTPQFVDVEWGYEEEVAAADESSGGTGGGLLGGVEDVKEKMGRRPEGEAHTVRATLRLPIAAVFDERRGRVVLRCRRPISDIPASLPDISKWVLQGEVERIREDKLWLGWSRALTQEEYARLRGGREVIVELPQRYNQLTPHGSFKREGKVLLPLAHQIPVVPDQGEYLGEQHDARATVRFLSSVGVFGELNARDERGQPRLEPGNQLRVGEPFRVEVEFEEDLADAGGGIALYENSDYMTFLRRVHVESVGGSRRVYRSPILTLVYEAQGRPGEVLLLGPPDGTSLEARTARMQAAAGVHAGRAEASVAPPFQPGTGSLAVHLLGGDDKQMWDWCAELGVVTLIGPQGARRLERGDQQPSQYLERQLATGSYTVRLDIMGARIEVESVLVKERGHTNVDIGGSREFGWVGWSREAYRFFDNYFGSSDRLECRYQREGRAPVLGDGFWDVLPKGRYDVSVSSSLFPEKTWPIVVEPGKNTHLNPLVGLLVLHDTVRFGASGRHLVASVRGTGLSSQSISFQKKSVQVLPVGEYIVEVMEKGREARHHGVIRIKPAKATFFAVGETPADSTPEDSPRGSPFGGGYEGDPVPLVPSDGPEFKPRGGVYIALPLAGAPLKDAACGHYQDIDEDAVIWVYTKALSSGLYNLTRARRTSGKFDGRWVATGLVLAGQEGSEHELGVLLTDARARRALEERSEGLVALPKGTCVMQKVVVTRAAR